MSETIVDDAVSDRREILSQQFDEAAAASVAPVDPVAEKPAVSRDAAGKFAAQAATGGAAPEPEAEPPAWHRPPQSWKKEKHGLWDTAAPELREYAFQREEEMRNGVLPLQEKARFADSMQAAVEPYLPTIRGLGVDAPTAVRALLEADRMLRSSAPQERLAYLRQLAHNYGIDLSGASETPENNPQVDARYSDLANQVNQIRGQWQAERDAAAAAEDRALQEDISKFSSTHEHFETLKPEMIRLLNGGSADSIEEAYKKAMRLDDGLFESSQKSLQDATAIDKRVAADRAAKSARAAAVSVRGSTPGAKQATKATDRRSILEDQFSGLSERL